MLFRRELFRPCDHPLCLHHLWCRHLLWVCLYRGAQPGLHQWRPGTVVRHDRQTRLSFSHHALNVYLSSTECGSVCWRQWQTVPRDQRPGCWQVPGKRWVWCGHTLWMSNIHLSRVTWASVHMLWVYDIVCHVFALSLFVFLRCPGACPTNRLAPVHTRSNSLMRSPIALCAR